MTVAQLKEHLMTRQTESRARLAKMRNICGKLESTVKESRSLPDITAIKDEIQKEFADFIVVDDQGVED